MPLFHFTVVILPKSAINCFLDKGFTSLPANLVNALLSAFFLSAVKFSVVLYFLQLFSWLFFRRFQLSSRDAPPTIALVRASINTWVPPERRGEWAEFAGGSMFVPESARVWARRVLSLGLKGCVVSNNWHDHVSTMADDYYRFLDTTHSLRGENTRKIYRLGDRFLNGMPLVRPVYSAAKQLLEAMTGSSSTSFKEVVLVEYPREGAWAIGFITKRLEIVKEGIRGSYVAVFIPSTPTPMVATGSVSLGVLKDHSGLYTLPYAFSAVALKT